MILGTDKTKGKVYAHTSGSNALKSYIWHFFSSDHFSVFSVKMLISLFFSCNVKHWKCLHIYQWEMGVSIMACLYYEILFIKKWGQFVCIDLGIPLAYQIKKNTLEKNMGLYHCCVL